MWLELYLARFNNATSSDVYLACFKNQIVLERDRESEREREREGGRERETKTQRARDRR